MKRRTKLIFFIPIFIVIGIFIVYLFYGKEETLNLSINNVDLSKLSDGTYLGSYSRGRFSYRVEVIIKNNKITAVNILNKPSVSLGGIPDKIIEKVLEKQSLDVDVITGATVSSKAILKAIENALSK